MSIENEIQSRYQLRDELSLNVKIPGALLVELITQPGLLDRLTIFKALFRLKGISLPSSFSLKDCQHSVFNLLSNSGTSPIYVGLQGTFWDWKPNLRSLPPEEYFSDQQKDETQVIWKFTIASKGDKCILTKSLFTRSLSLTAHRRFEKYWKLSRGFSRLGRFFLLWSMKRNAEKMSK